VRVPALFQVLRGRQASPRRSKSPAILITAAAGAALLAMPAGTAVAAPAASIMPAAAQAAAGASRPAADAPTLAADQARRTGKPVVIPSLTTPTSTTQALPNGQFEMTTSARPVRTWAGGAWRNLDATLRRNSDGTWSPAVPASPVTISGGGTGALATMTSSPGRDLALFWPGSLPRPEVAGSTATYRSVLPGVDLRVTVDAEGGVRDVLIVHDRTAAASPQLRQMALTTVASGGLQLTTSPDGGMRAATRGGAPAFTAAAPLMWDSATTAAPLARSQMTAALAQVAALAPTAPAASTPDRPGRKAHAASVKATLGAPQRLRGGITRQVLSLIPDAAMLSGAGTVYPAYVDPTWLNSGGARGWYASDASGSLADSNKYNGTADPVPENYLQVGYNDSFNAHTFVDMQLVPSQLKGASIDSAVIQFTEEASWSCTPEPIELWQAGAPPLVNGKPWVSWNNEPMWQRFTGTGALADGAITSQTVAHGHTGCEAAAVQFDISNFMKAKGPAGPSNIAFGLKAPDLNSDMEWKEFSNAAGAITMTTFYDHAPDAQVGSSMSPGGACQSTSPAKTLVGNDDFTLATTPTDQDGGGLTVHFVVTNYGSSVALVNTSKTATSNVPIPFTIPRSQVQGWHNDGATVAHTYAWYTYTVDGTGLDNKSDTGLGSPAKPCLFTYDPTAPQAPDVMLPAAGADDAIGTLGTSVNFTFGNCSTVLDSPPVACTGPAPASYIYQVNDGPPKTVAVTGTTQQVSIPLTHVGPNTISLTGISAAGNLSAASLTPFGVDRPATDYADGDYAGTGHPALITVGSGTGTTDQPGLWLAQSDGTGALSTPVDIGARGTGVSSGSPADWAGAQVLHGDFALNGVEDIVAYYPCYDQDRCGGLRLVDGPGTAAALDPESGNTAGVNGLGIIDNPGTPGAVSEENPGSWSPFADTNLDSSGTDTPIQLVAAGNASGRPLTQPTLPDLIGIFGDATNGYELNLYTATQGTSFSIGYASLSMDASTTATANGPDGNPWGPNWTLAVAEPPGNPVLFALDKATGQLWESVTSASGVIGTTGTWTKATGGPWTAGSGPALVQADVNTAGSIELWTTSGGTATAWTLPVTLPSGATTFTLSQEAALSTRRNPGHEWPLSDGALGASTLMDTENDSTGATPSSGVTTDPDPVLGSVAEFSGTAGGSLTLPAGMVQDSTSSHAALQAMTLTLRFKVKPGDTGILAGTSAGSLTDATLSTKSAPIMYVGTDGFLFAQFPSAHVSSSGVVAQDIAPLESATRVDDGLWHSVTLVADSASHDQVLYLDNKVPIHLWDNGSIDTATPATIINPGQTTATQAYGADQVTIGAGIFSPAGWVNADATNGARGTTRLSYFTGDISDVAFYPNVALTLTQLPQQSPRGVSTPINSGVLSTQCVELAAGTQANGTVIQINTCATTGKQAWVIQPGGVIAYAPNNAYCVTATANGTALGTLIELFTCNGSTGQTWEVLSNGSIMNPHSGKCIDDPSGSITTGTQLQLYTCNGTVAQTWSSSVRPDEAPQMGTIVSTGSGLCVQNAGGSASSAGSTTSGSQAQAGTCNGFLSQQLTFQPDGTITVAGLCLNNNGGNTTDGNAINFATCNGTGAQVWAHPDTGAIRNPATGKCIQGSTTSGAQLQLFTCDLASHQAWVYSSTWNH
jgi:hypothetical protein